MAGWSRGGGGGHQKRERRSQGLSAGFRSVSMGSKETEKGL